MPGRTTWGAGGSSMNEGTEGGGEERNRNALVATPIPHTCCFGSCCSRCCCWYCCCCCCCLGSSHPYPRGWPPCQWTVRSPGLESWVRLRAVAEAKSSGLPEASDLSSATKIRDRAQPSEVNSKRGWSGWWWSQPSNALAGLVGGEI